MKLMTEKAQVKYAIAKQEAIDPSDRSGVLEKLKALPDTATAEDVQAVVGHGRWVRPARCDECDTVSYLAIEVGEEDDYESRTAVLCFECVKKAYLLLIDSQRAEKESSVVGTENELARWIPCADRFPIPSESPSGYFWCWNESAPDLAPELLGVYGYTDYHESPCTGFCCEGSGIVSDVTHWMPANPPAPPKTTQTA